MALVSQFEAGLLEILRQIFGGSPLEQTWPLACQRLARPSVLSPEALDLVRDALARGSVATLAREGWRRERHLRNGRPREGRLWHRTPPRDLFLAFSQQSLDFLIWLTASAPDGPAPLPAGGETVGDRLLFFLTYRLLRDTEAGPALRRLPLWRRDGLCRLMFPDDFANEAADGAPEWDPWITGVGAFVLESLQVSLTRRWVEVERSKGQIRSPARMRALGRAQEQSLRGFCDMVTSAGRWDLARFLLRAARELLDGEPAAAMWVGGLDLDGVPMAERLEARRAAVTMLRQLGLLHHWEQLARTISYFDDGYAAAQMWKDDWQRHGGPELYRRAQQIVREVEGWKP